MKYSNFWIFIFTIVTTFSCSAIPQDKLEFSYTGIPDLYVELSEVHLLDINGIKYSAYVNQDFRLSEITILMSGELIGVAGKCLQDIHFPDLQTLKVSKSVRKEDLKIYL